MLKFLNQNKKQKALILNFRGGGSQCGNWSEISEDAHILLSTFNVQPCMPTNELGDRGLIDCLGNDPRPPSSVLTLAKW